MHKLIHSPQLNHNITKHEQQLGCIVMVSDRDGAGSSDCQLKQHINTDYNADCIVTQGL